MSKIKLYAYLAGPYSGKKDKIVQENIEAAIKAARYLQKQGYTVFCPHSNFAYLKGIDNTVFGREEILEMCISWMQKCDIVFFLPGWRDSPGSVEEHRIAKIRRVPRKYLTKKELSEYNNSI